MFFQTRDSQSTEDRKKVTDLLCHSTAVSDAFYARNPGEEEARHVRGIIDAALEEETVDSRLPPSAEGMRDERHMRQRCSGSHVLLSQLRLPQYDDMEANDP